MSKWLEHLRLILARWLLVACDQEHHQISTELAELHMAMAQLKKEVAAATQASSDALNWLDDLDEAVDELENRPQVVCGLQGSREFSAACDAIGLAPEQSAAVAAAVCVPAVSAHKCDVCNVALQLDAIRTHDGKWRCAEHKGA